MAFFATPIGIAVLLIAVLIGFLFIRKFVFGPKNIEIPILFPVKVDLVTSEGGHSEESFNVDYVIRNRQSGDTIGNYKAEFAFTGTPPYIRGDIIGTVTIIADNSASGSGTFSVPIANPYPATPLLPSTPPGHAKLPIGENYKINVLHNYANFSNVSDPPPHDVIEPREP